MKNIIAIATAAIFIVSCSKDKDLPDPTDTGEHKFGAKVNGEIWEARGFGPFPANDVLEAVRYGSSGDIVIKARNFASSPLEKEFYIFVKGATATGTYPLNSNASHLSWDNSYAYYVVRNFTPQNEWITSVTHPGSVTFSKIDTVNRILAGTFQFEMLNWYNTPQPLSVTEGRFDIRY